MKRCPECRRDYYDETLLYCLEDGRRACSGLGAVARRTDDSDLVRTGRDRDRISGRRCYASSNSYHSSGHGTSKELGRLDGKAKPFRSSGGKAAFCSLAAVILLVGGFFGYRYFISADGGAIDSIAVLPFENRSNNTEADYLADGLAESLIYRLSQLPNLKVSPTSSVMRYKGQGGNLKTIADELGVHAVMTGKVVQRGESLSISIELIDVLNNKLLWGEQYERKMADLLATQREIATAITQKLELKLAGDEKGIAKKYTNSNEAYQLYMRGRYHFARRTKDDFGKAIESYEQAIKLDPEFALAHARIAEAYNQMSNYPYASPREAFPKAKAAAERAITIDPTLSEGHTAMGNALTSFDWNWAEAEKSFKRGLELDPNSTSAHYRYGFEYLVSVGKTKEGLAEIQRGLEIEPLDPNMVANLSRAYLYDRQRERTLEVARKTYEADPSFVNSRLFYGIMLNANGHYSEAIAMSQETLTNDPNNQHMLMISGYAFARSGQRARAETVTQRFNEISKTGNVIPSFLATIYGAMGEKEKAFAELEKSIEVRDSWFKWGKVEPLFDQLRDDPRYAGLLKRMGLPE